MLGSAPSTMSCTSPRFEAKSFEKTMAISAFWLRISCSASLGVATAAVMVKYSEAASLSTACWVRWSVEEVTTMVRTFFTSVVMA